MCGGRPVILRFSLSGSLSPNPFPFERFWSGIKESFDPKLATFLLEVQLVWEVWKTGGPGSNMIVIFESKFKLQQNKLHHQMTYHLIFLYPELESKSSIVRFESAEWSGITLCVHFCCRQVLACSLPFSPWLLPSFSYSPHWSFWPRFLSDFQILKFGLLYGVGGNKATKYPRIRKPIHLCS